MSAYRIDMSAPVVVHSDNGVITIPGTVPVPCKFVPSKVAGKTLCLNEDDASIVVEPNGSQVRTVPAGADNWDSEWTQAEILDGFLVYRSSGGVPRMYKMVGGA